MEGRVITDYNLLFVTRGKVVWVIDDVPYTLTPQSLLLVPPGPWHHACSLTKRVTLLSMHFHVRLAGGVDVMAYLNPPSVAEVGRNSRLDQYLHGLLTDYQGQSHCPSQELVPGWTHLVVHAYLRRQVQAGNLSLQSVDPMIPELLDLLSEHLASPLTLPQIAQMVGYTPQHTNRLFRQALGVTPLQYLMQLRMNRAADLLAEGIFAIHAIGKAVGFEDPYYFSRMFKQYHSRSPQQYQQMICSDSPSSASTSPF